MRHVAIAAVYAILYLVLVQVSDGLWVITSGLRLSFLLVTPYRYWPALFIAEGVPLGFHLSEIALHSGWTAAWLCSFPPIGIGMPLFALYRRRIRPDSDPHAIDAGALVVCALVLSVTWATINYGILWTAKAPATEPAFHVNATQFLLMLVGQYAGIVSTLPLVLVVMLNYRPLPLGEMLHQLANSRLVTDLALFLVPSIGILFVMTTGRNQDIATVWRIFAFAVLTMLTIMHGWTAAAVGSAGIIATIALTGPTTACTSLLASQAVACFAVTSLLLLGALREGQRHLLVPYGADTAWNTKYCSKV